MSRDKPVFFWLYVIDTYWYGVKISPLRLWDLISVT